MTYRIPRLLSALPLLGLLALGAGPTPVRPEVGGTTGLLQPAIGDKLPPLSLAAEALARVPTSNGKGQVSANVDGRLLSIEESRTTHLGKLVLDRGMEQYRVYVQSNTGETSITLILLGHVGTWRLGSALIEVQGVRYAMTKGSAHITETEPGKLTGTFSLVAQRMGRLPGVIEVSSGKFTIAPNS